MGEVKEPYEGGTGSLLEVVDMMCGVTEKLAAIVRKQAVLIEQERIAGAVFPADLSEERKQADVAVQQAFLDSEEYKSCTTVLAYVSSDIEVSTAEIVRKALKSKIVLCPRCEKNGNIMYFYRINSTYDL